MSEQITGLGMFLMVMASMLPWGLANLAEATQPLEMWWQRRKRNQALRELDAAWYAERDDIIGPMMFFTISRRLAPLAAARGEAARAALKASLAGGPNDERRG